MRRILAEGPPDAHIALYGESPWTTEDATGRPFAGASGNLLRRWWTDLGMSREEILIDNMYPFKPPGFPPPGDRLQNIAASELVRWMRDLHVRIAELPDVRVVVPTGNYATFALLGKGKVPARVHKELGGEVTQTEAEKKAGIVSLRGSIYQYRDLNGRWLKVVPTIHPAGVLQMPKWEDRSVRDWRRIKEEALTPAFTPSVPHILIEPTVSEVTTFIRVCQAHPGRPIALDVETWGNTLSCCGFAHSRDYAIVLKTASKADRAFWMPWIKAICALPNAKIMQNGFYDTYWLRWYGVSVQNWLWDTMCMHHVINSQDSHSLEYLTSIHTRQQYYKDEAKDAEEIRKYARDLDALWVYNGTDCCTPWEIFHKLFEELKISGRLGFYLQHYQQMFQPLLDTMLHGVRVDVPGQKVYAKTCLKECDELRVRLAERAGEELYATERKSEMRRPTGAEWDKLVIGDGFDFEIDGVPGPKFIDRLAAKSLNYTMSGKKGGLIKEYFETRKKDFSRLKLIKFFGTTLGLKLKVKRGKKEPTVDEVALRELALRNPKQAEWMLAVIRHREKKRERDYVKGAWDGDGRIRCSYKLTTDAGRLASSKNPRRKGYNLQNVKRGEIRRTFRPDEGCVFVRVDMSQDEDRRVKMYTRQPRMVELANLRPNEYDAHTENAKAIFGVAEPTKEQRYLGKKAVHAAQRGMMGKKLAEELLKDEYVMTAKECQRLIDRYFEANPEIRDYYFAYVRETFLRDRELRNTWGRTIKFDAELSMGRMDEDVWRKLYSFLPQSECADNLNQNGFIPASAWMRRELGKPPNIQVHDEIVASLPVERVWDYVTYIIPLLESPRWYFDAKLRVPACVTVGMSWDGGHEWKRLPERDEFEAVCHEVYRKGEAK